MAIAVFVLTCICAEMSVIRCKIPIIVNHILRKTQTKTRYDVTQMLYVAFIHHLLVGIYILTNVDAEFNANRAKIAPAKNILFFTLEKPMMPC